LSIDRNYSFYQFEFITDYFGNKRNQVQISRIKEPGIYDIHIPGKKNWSLSCYITTSWLCSQGWLLSRGSKSLS